MKRFGVTLFLFVLWLSLSAIAQYTGQQSSTTNQGSSQTTTTQSTTPQTTTKMSGAKLEHLKGKISDDGKTLTSDKDNKTWNIDNPEAVKGHEGHDVRVSGNFDPANNSVHVMSVKMAGMAIEKGGAMQPPK